MSISKMLSGVLFASVFALGCGSDESSASQDQVERALRGDGYTNPNYNQLLGGKAGESWISGLYFDGSKWYLSTQTDQTYAAVSRITYDGNELAPSELTTSQGMFMLLGNSKGRVEERGHTLDFYVEGALTGMLRMVPAGKSSDGTFVRYTALWVADGSDPDTAESFCPHTVLSDDGTPLSLQEYVIPIGGARWALSGSRTSDAAAITLSCTHDAVGGCVSWGYLPWGGSRVDEDGQTRSMVNVHQACTRMKSGDFCGNGEGLTTGQSTYTVQRQTMLHVKDRVGIHPDTNQTFATMEAFWDENGATCVNQSEYRSSDPLLLQKLPLQLASCPARNVPCSLNARRMFLSARPCTQTNTSGDCIAN
ncbi:MAG TPA: ADYC domain-containing protein [Pseudomonadota bacterium]|nr:ADYC domain-containing protein [Pseudomonadota bacterium]